MIRRNRKTSVQARRTKIRRRPTIEGLEFRKLMTVTTFQEGALGYSGQQDTVMFSLEPNVNLGTAGVVGPDQQDQNGVRQGLVRFDNIIGANAIPRGAKINSATLVVDVKDSSNSAMQMSLYRMLTDWNENTATWNSFGQIGGVQSSEGESTDLPPEAVLLDSNVTSNSPLTAGRFDVTRSLEYWSTGADNFGWLVESASTNGWDMFSKESPLAQRPKLTVDWQIPATNEFRVLTNRFTSAEGDEGPHTAFVDVARLGDLAAAASVSYTVTAGTAQGGDFVAVTTGTLEFAANQGLARIPVSILGDRELEGGETVLVTLTGPQVDSSRGVSEITIGDDDALINEVLANVSNADDETNREFIELIGTPDASLDNYYFVVLEGEEEGDSGATLDGSSAGVADFVLSLQGQKFGSNGILVITPSTWEYESLAAPGTSIVKSASLDRDGGILEDNSQTYALIRSATPIVAGVDYDTVGTFENNGPVAIGVGVGILDQLPAGAQIVDSVGIVEGGGSDRDRVLSSPTLGHPGIHVHQPSSALPGGNVASDAVSRRVGQRLPNSIGAWFNGDMTDGTPASGLRYLNDSFAISVTAPDGAVLTPGSPNTLRTVYVAVADQGKEIAEAAGSVTLRVERTGDLSEAIEVSYKTVDIGSATENVDYRPASGTLQFNPGDSSREITLEIMTDQVAEGFQRFRVDITNATGGYLITDGRPNTPLTTVNGEAVVTIVDANVSTKSFQNGENNYEGTTDAFLDGEFITDKFGQDLVVRVDQVKGGSGEQVSAVRPQQGLLRFDDLFGNEPHQVPQGSTIFDAFLTLNVQNASSGASIGFFRMLQDWDQVNATWSNPQGRAGVSIVNGVTPDDVESSAVADFLVRDPGRAGLVQIPLNVETVQAWANGSLPNFGWSIVSDSATSWAFNSSESFFQGTARPELTILYNPPVAEAVGNFALSSAETIAPEGGSAAITIHRIGGTTGPQDVRWSVSVGPNATGGLDDLSGPATGVVSFASGELHKSFTVQIAEDTNVERNETLTVSLSGEGIGFSRQQAELVIRDNDFSPLGTDLLLNEIFINSPGNDPPHEFVELKGKPGVGMGSLYYVAIEGLVGDREGSMEKVVDLGEFVNGTATEDGKGYTLLTPAAQGFAFQVPNGTTHIDHLGPTSQENVASDNGSTTYMILYSPLRRLTEFEYDYDWDNDGALELPAGVQIVDSLGIRIIGSQDQLYGPSSNVLSTTVDPEIDAVSRNLTNTQKNRADAWFGGNLRSAGDDYLLYEPAISFGLPVSGSTMSPGKANTSAESRLVALQSITTNANGTISVVFDGPVSQVRIGDGGPAAETGAGISITDSNGVPLPQVDPIPRVSGLGTETLVLTFTGSGVMGGKLPAGQYKLNLAGNGIVANGRAVDVAQSGGQINGVFSQVITITDNPRLDGDLDGDGTVAFADFLILSANFGKTSAATAEGDIDGDKTVAFADFLILSSNFGRSIVPSSASTAETRSVAATDLVLALDPFDLDRQESNDEILGILTSYLD